MLKFRPQRIVSLAPSCTETIFALGAQKHLVGVTRYCDEPPEAGQIEQVGGFIDIQYEKIVSLKPDLVLISSFLQRQIAEKLVNLDLTVLSLNPICLEDIYTKIRWLGLVVDKEREAEVLIAEMQEKIDFIEQKAKGMQEHPSIYIEEWGVNAPIRISGVWVAELAEKAGGRNIFADRIGIKHSSFRSVTLEEVRERDPEVIISIFWKSSRFNVTPEQIRSRPGWQNIRAVKNNRIYTMDDRIIIRPGPRIIQGMEQFFSFFYPGRNP